MSYDPYNDPCDTLAQCEADYLDAPARVASDLDDQARFETDADEED